MNTEFMSLKREIINLINYKCEITSKTKYKTGGIYLLYVDNFNDDKIIPIYIGNTNNFQERHKEHLKEIFALNRLSKKYYIDAIINKYYDGYYKSCKIFKYMVDTDCTLKDLHMVILEECDEEEKRLILEHENINKYLSSFYGFNQLNSISLQTDYLNKGILSKFYLDCVKNDILNLVKYKEYGFSEFNYMLAKGLFEYYEKDSLNKLSLFSEFNDLTEKRSKYEKKLKSNVNYILYQSKEECYSICGDIINSFFEKNNLKSNDKKKQIIKYLLFNSEKDKNEVNRYIQRFSIDKSEDLFLTIFENKGNEILNISDKINKYKQKNSEYKEKIYKLSLLIYDDIIPNKEYISFPLKDNCFSDFNILNKENNTLYINIEFSNHGKKELNDDYPCILKVDYLFCIDGNIINNSYFIKSSFDDFFVDNDEYYINVDLYGNVRDPFNIWKYSVTRDYNTISTSMEYYNGINEFTLIGKEKIKFSEVINEIDNLINQDTKVIYTSGCKKLLKIYDGCESLIIKKILKQLKY